MLNIKNIFFRICSLSNIDNRLFRLQSLINKCLNYGNGGEFHLSGEKELIRKLFVNYPSKSIIFFDVGANNGDYASSVIDCLGDKINQYYCFEPSSTTRAVLEEKVGARNNVFVYPLGLSDKCEDMLLLSSSKSSGLSTFYNRDLSHYEIKYDSSENVKVVTLDSFCQNEGIDRVDFLKMDIEGHELAAMNGGIQMIQSRKIKYIQFEFGGCNIDSRTYLKDFYKVLSCNYDLYRIQRYSIVKMPEYSEVLENFTTTNYLAILK